MNPLPPAMAVGQAPVLRALVEARAGRPIRSVAVVGNAPLPPSDERAAAIDGSDLVVRMTTFAVDEDEPVIGRRSDVVVVHRAVLAGPSTFADYSRRVYLLGEPGRLHWEPERAPEWWPADLGAIPISNAEFTLSLNEDLGYGGEVRWATTGLLSLWVMHRVLPEASIIFTGTTLPAVEGEVTTFAHAWGADVPVTAEHDLTSERDALARWHASGWLTVLD